MKESATGPAKRVPVVLIVIVIVIAIPLALGAWWLERKLHWKLAYEDEVNQKIESLSREVQDLTRRVERLESSAKAD